MWIQFSRTWLKDIHCAGFPVVASGALLCALEKISQSFEGMKGLFSKETVSPRQWRSEKRKFWYQTSWVGANFHRRKINDANVSSISPSAFALTRNQRLKCQLCLSFYGGNLTFKFLFGIKILTEFNSRLQKKFPGAWASKASKRNSKAKLSFNLFVSIVQTHWVHICWIF